MRRGQIIRVFQKPITEERFEGIAKIISVDRTAYDRETGLHRCKVQFEIDERPVIRYVKSKHLATIK